MKFLVTGAAGFLGWRIGTLLRESGNEVVALARPSGAERAAATGLDPVLVDAGDPGAGELILGCDAVLHFAGVPDPGRAATDPARAVRENAGTTLNLLEGCLEAGAGLIYPSTIRAAAEPPPDAYALSKRLGEAVCSLHEAPATVVRLTSVYGPGQVAWEGATGAIAAFAARALEGAPIVIPGNPERRRDFIYVDDLVPALERVVADARWNESFTLATGVATPLSQAAELACRAAGSPTAIETPGGTLPPGENETYEMPLVTPGLDFAPRALEEGVQLYVEWLRRHPAAQGRTRSRPTGRPA
jgi:UDP-glucose 4-epimerase